MTGRRRIAALLPLSLAAVWLAGAAPPAKKAGRPSKQYTIEQFYATTGVRDASFSSDEKRILFSSNQTGVYNVYSVPVTGGIKPHPATRPGISQERVVAASQLPGRSLTALPVLARVRCSSGHRPCL